jgi:iron complex outermembrane receptor protein
LVAVAVAQIMAMGPVWAQSASTPAGSAPTTTADTGGLQEVTVTAQRREQSLQDTPVTITAITPQDIQNRAIYSTQDVQVMAPALKLSNNVTTPTNLSLGYRGSTQQDASLIVAESPIGIYVDDIYIARMNGNNVEFPDIDNIEFLRGPQGTLYGRNTEQGALTFHSRTPGDEAWVQGDAGVGNYSQYRTDFSIGQPLGEGWAMSLAGMYNYKNGEFYNIGTNTPWDREENYGGRAKIHYYGSDVFEMTAFTTLVHSENDALPLVKATTPSDPTNGHVFTSNQVVPTFGYYTVDEPVSNYGVATINGKPEGSVDQTINGLTLQYKLGSLTLKSISGFVTTKDTFTTAFAGITPIGTGEVGASSEVGGEVMNDKQYSQEFQGLGKALDDRLDYIGGLYIFRESGGQEFGWYGFGLGPLSNSWISLTTDSYAAYGQSSFKLTDALSVTAGLRWTEEKKNIHLALVQLGALGASGGFGGAFPHTAPIHDDLTFAALTPKFGVDYKLPVAGYMDSALLYADAERGYKSGGVSGINIFDLTGSLVPYKPEYNWTYEIGTKTEFLDHKVRINADYFLANVSNLVLNETVSVAGGGSSFPEVNAGDTRVQGLEMEISAAPIRNLTMYINPAFETGRYTAVNPASSAAYSELANCPNAGATSGAPCNNGYSVLDPKPPQLPWFSFSSGFDYKYLMPIGSLTDSGLVIGADWFKTAPYRVSSTGDFISGAYDRLNGYIGMAISTEMQLRLEAKNIQNRVTINTGSRGLGGFDVLPPREILLTLSYKQNGTAH